MARAIFGSVPRAAQPSPVKDKDARARDCFGCRRRARTGKRLADKKCRAGSVDREQGARRTSPFAQQFDDALKDEKAALRRLAWVMQHYAFLIFRERLRADKRPNSGIRQLFEQR